MDGNCQNLVTLDIIKKLGKSLGDTVAIKNMKRSRRMHCGNSRWCAEGFWKRKQSKRSFRRYELRIHKENTSTWLQRSKTLEKRKAKMIEMILAGKKGI